MHTTST
ncbi:hypothetical protein E2C01_061234 [Portunus trituberculatus]|nr:hypothetical protein [Portunus trituberculatus]